jgi:hypothetical protein
MLNFNKETPGFALADKGQFQKRYGYRGWEGFD